MEAIKKMDKKKIAIGAGILLVIAIAIYFLMRGKDKASKIAVATLPTDNPSSGLFPSGKSPQDYDYTIPEETEAGIIPDWAGGDGTKQKRKLDGGRAEFDRKAKAIMMQITNEAPDGDWYKQVEKSTAEYWTPTAGMDIGEAIYKTARTFIAAKVYY